MSLGTPKTVRKLQEALHAKAKESSDFRFYSLYDKVYRADVLAFAYRRCRRQGGAPGVDGERFEAIEAYGVERWLGELTEELEKKTYRPQAVRRVWIPKPNGSKRPLGIPTIRDRVVQTAAVLVLEPVFEADLQPEQYAHRPGRSALDAVQRVHGLLNAGHTEVVDADLKGYFDEIPHAELMKSVSRRVSDGALLQLIKLWLQAPVEEIDDRGRRHRTTPAKDRGRGCPQGADLPAARESLHASVHPRMEGARTRKGAGGADRQLRRRSRDLLPQKRRRRPRGDAQADAAAEAHGERGEDLRAPHPRRIGRLPRVYPRSLLLAPYGSRLYWHDPVESERAASPSGDQ
jgi:hypothetical protein